MIPFRQSVSSTHFVLQRIDHVLALTIASDDRGRAFRRSQTDEAGERLAPKVDVPPQSAQGHDLDGEARDAGRDERRVSYVEAGRGQGTRTIAFDAGRTPLDSPEGAGGANASAGFLLGLP